MYTAFASVYDRLMADVDYSAWAAFYRELLCQRGIQSGTVCECACGTGSLTLPLHRTYDMTGVDISEDMLAVAQSKARQAGQTIPFVCMDMCRLTLHRPQDAVLCTCDGINYLPDEDAIRAFFCAAHQALKPGGALLFDVSTPYKLKHVLGNHTHGEDQGDIAYLWQNQYDTRQDSVDLSLVIFQQTPQGSYERIDEQQTQHAYSWQRLTALLQDAGFTDVQVCGDQTLAPPGPKETRWHIAATKKER